MKRAMITVALLAAIIALPPPAGFQAQDSTAFAKPTLHAEVDSPLSIAISWTPVTGATRYALWTWWDAEIGWQLISDTLTDTSYAHTGLAPGTTYHYTVGALDAGGEPKSRWADYVREIAFVHSGDMDADRDALVALYNATNGAGWTNNENWLTDRPIGEWHGVTTDANGSVTKLHITHNQLRGPIPSELGNLSRLDRLDLSDNELSGSIQSELGNLANLAYLFLHGNELSGCIPAALQNVAHHDLNELNLPFCN